MRLDSFAGVPVDPRLLRRFNAVIVLLVLLAVGIPGSVWASHQFSDVPDSHTHHATISAANNAGITSGCTASTYCPQDPVTRGQMASFLHRGLGRASLGAGNFVLVSESTTTVATVTISAPGVPGTGTQFVKVDATFQLWQTVSTGCPCEAIFFLRDEATGSSSQIVGEHVHNAGTEDQATGALTWVFPIEAGGTRTYSLRARRETGTSTGLRATSAITAVTVPYGSTGGNTL